MRTRSSRSGFTLVELMVVAAIIVILLGVTMAAIKALLDSNALANSENTLRFSLNAARSYAVQHNVVAGIRCQDDGHVVQVYASNYHAVFNPEGFRKSLTSIGIFDNIFKMKAVPGVLPAKLSGPWRVTVRDVGACDNYSDSGSMNTVWAAEWADKYGIPLRAAPEWLDKNAWFAFPVVLFDQRGGLCLMPCKFSGDPADPWYPTLEGSFGKVTTAQRNPNPLYSLNRSTPYQNQLSSGPPTDTELIYTNMPSWCGWRVLGYYGQGGGNPDFWRSQELVVETPTVSGALRLFDYYAFRSVYPGDVYDSKAAQAAVDVVMTTASDIIVNSNTGSVTRWRHTRSYED